MTLHLCLIKFYSNLILIETQHILNKYHCKQTTVDAISLLQNRKNIYFDCWLMTLKKIAYLAFRLLGHLLSAFAKFSEKLTFLTPWYAHVRVRIRELKMVVFRKSLRTYLMDGPCGDNHPRSKLYITKFFPPHIQK